MTILKRSGSRALVRAERLIAIAAVAATAYGFTQPQVLMLAGLDFGQPQAMVGIDPVATGSVARKDPAAAAPPRIHGLAGTLKALRSRE